MYTPVTWVTLCGFILSMSGHMGGGPLLVESTNGGCPPSSVEYGGRCIYHTRQTYSLATEDDRNVCNAIVNNTAYEAHLVSVRSMPELHFFWSLASRPSPQHQYIGLFHNGGQWNWQDGSTDITMMWADTQPDSVDTDQCAYISSTKGQGFHNQLCTTALPVTCEFVPIDTTIVTENCDWILTLDRRLSNPDKVILADYDVTECMAKCRTEDGCASIEWQSNSQECRLNNLHTTTASVVQEAESGVQMYDLYCRSDDFGPLLYYNGVTKENVSLSASSEFDTESNSSGAVVQWGSLWRSAENTYQWLQIDLGKLAQIDKLELFGGYVTNCYVTSFYLASSNFSTLWKIYKDVDTTEVNKLFQGVASQTDSMNHVLDPPIITRYVRVIPVAQYIYNCLKLELYGGRLALDVTPMQEFGDTNSPLGLESGDVEDNQFSASSFDTLTEYFYPPWEARLNNNVTSVVGFQYPFWQLAVNHWIQVDLITPNMISGLAIQGAGEAHNSFISSFKLLYALDTIIDLIPITDNEGNDLVFDGNIDPHAASLISLNDTVEARWLRLYVVAVSTKAVLRMELYGQPKVIDAPKISKASAEDTTEGTCSCELDSSLDENTYKLCLSEGSVLNVTYKSLYLVHGIEIGWENTVSAETMVMEPVVKVLSGRSGDWLMHNMMRLNDTEPFRTMYRFDRMKKAMGISVNISSVTEPTCLLLSVYGYKAKACPPGYVQYHSKCYTIVQGSYNLMESSEWKNSSFDVCKQTSWNGLGRMATITDIQENYAVWNLMSRSKKVFIGHIARNLSETSDFKWTHYETDETAAWTFWQSGSPASTIQTDRCTSLDITPYWYQTSCEASLMIACEVDASVDLEPGTCANAEWESYLYYYPTKSLFVQDVSLDGLTIWQQLSLCQDGTIIPNCSAVYYVSSTNKVYFSVDTTKNANLILTVSGTYDYFEFSAQKDGCSKALVWDNYPIQVSVDGSSVKSAKMDVGYAELTNEISTWTPNWNQYTYEFLQVDFHVIAEVTKVVLRGGASVVNCHLTQYMLMFTNDTRWWEVYKYETGEIKYFTGIYGRYFLHQIYLDQPIIARFVRLVPTGRVGSICARFELFGSFVGRLHSQGCTTVMRSSGLYDAISLKYSFIEINGVPKFHAYSAHNQGLNIATLDPELCQADLGQHAANTDSMIHLMDHTENGTEILGVTNYQLFPLASTKEYLASLGLARLSNYNNQAAVTYCFITSNENPSVNRDVLANQHYGPKLLSHVWQSKKTPGIDVSEQDLPVPVTHWPLNPLTKWQDISANSLTLNGTGSSSMEFGFEYGTAWKHGYAYFDGTRGLTVDIKDKLVLRGSFSISLAVFPEGSTGSTLFEFTKDSSERSLLLALHDDVNQLYMTTSVNGAVNILLNQEGTINDKIWNFITITYNERLQLLRLYRNGKVILHSYVDLTDIESLTNQNFLYIGTSGVFENTFYTGKMACLEFYNVQLSAIQVQKVVQRCRNSTDQFQDLGYVDDSFPEGPLGILTSLTPSQVKVSSQSGSWSKEFLALYGTEDELHQYSKSWRPASIGAAVNHEFVQVNLGLEHLVSAVVLKGAPFNNLYYTTGFVLEYADQLGNWNLITNSDGSNKTFTANFDPHYAVRVSVVKHNIRAQHIRLWPRGTYISLHVEILGYPLDQQLFLQTEQTSGSAPNCTPTVLINGYSAQVDFTDYWMSFDFKGVFYVSSVHINTSDHVIVDTYSLKVETRMDHEAWKLLPEVVQRRIITSENISSIRYHFVPVIRTKYLRVHLSGNQSCSSVLSVYGSVAPVCPPGSTLFGAKCVYPMVSSQTISSHVYPAAKAICKTYSWYSLSDFGITPSSLKIALYAGLMNSISTTLKFAWLSLEHGGSRESSYWSDGTSVQQSQWYINEPYASKLVALLYHSSALVSAQAYNDFEMICETDAVEGVLNDFTISKGEDMVYIHTTANGIFKLYVDGSYQGKRLADWWEFPFIVKTSVNLSVLAVEVEGNGNDIPVILSLISGDVKYQSDSEADVRPDGVGSAFLESVSDSSWKCSSVYEKLWTFPHFNDSHWNESTIMSNYTSGPALINGFTNLTAEPMWISAQNVAPLDTIYCRKTLSQPQEKSHSCELRWLYVEGRCAPDVYQAVSHTESATECMHQCLMNTTMRCGSVDYLSNAQPSCFYREERRTELAHQFVDVKLCHYFETWCPDYDDFLIRTMHAQGLASMSATHFVLNFEPVHGILDEDSSSWKTSLASSVQYLQADFDVLANISAISTRCLVVITLAYRVYYKNIEVGYDVPIVDNNGNAKIFTTNWDNLKYYTEILEEPVVTNRIRINPVSYKGSGIGLEFDVHGTILTDVEYTEAKAKAGLGMESQEIGATQIRLSTTTSVLRWHPHAARLNFETLSRQYGCAMIQANDYLEINLLISHKVTGIAFQKCPLHNYYIKKVQVQHSNDNLNWNMITDSVTGNEMEYDAVVFLDDVNVIFLPNVTDAMGIRLYSLDYNGARSVRVELYGEPNDCPVINDPDYIENVTVNGETFLELNSLLPMNTTDVEPLCFDANLNTIEIQLELSHLHMLTSFEFLQGTTITSFALQYSNNPQKWNSYQDPVNGSESISLHGTRHVKFSQALKAYMITVTANVTETENCVQFQLHGCPMDVCPPQFIPHEGRCYHESNYVGSYDEVADYCASTAWKGGGYPVMPKDRSQFEFVKAVANPDSARLQAFFIGLHSVNGNLTWADGSPVVNAEAMPWPSVPTSLCTYIGGVYNTLQETACTATFWAFCETTANYGKKTNETMSWIHRRSIIPSFTYQLLIGVDTLVTDCMVLCLETTTCKSFIQSRNYRKCEFAEVTYPSRSNSYSGNGYYHYFEYYMKDVCETELLAEAASITGSSYYDDSTGPEQVIYNTSYYSTGMSTYWRPAELDSVDPWVQASFAVPVEILGVSYTGTSDIWSYTKVLHLGYSVDGYSFQYYYIDEPTNSDRDITSPGGVEVTSEVTTRLQYPFVALHVKAVVSMATNIATLRLSLYGCFRHNLSVTLDTEQPLGIKSGRITDSQLASHGVFVSPDGTWNSPYAARLDLEDKGIDLSGWIPSTPTDVTTTFLQVDLYIMHTITSVLTQGKDAYYVNLYDIHYSTDRLNWIGARKDGSLMSYPGYKNAFAQTLSPNITALSVRLYPKGYTGQVLLQLELVGFPSDCPSIDAANTSSIEVDCDLDSKQLTVATTFEKNHLVTGVILRGLTEIYPQIQGGLLRFSNVSAEDEAIAVQLVPNSMDNTEWKLYILDAPEMVNFTLVITNVTECLTVEVQACPLPGCPLGYATLGGHCYFYPDVETTGYLLGRPFNETEENCQALSWAGTEGSVVLADDLETHFLLRSFIIGTIVKHFIDVVYDNTSFSWINNMDKAPLEFTHWDYANGHPDPSIGHCVISENAFWKSYPCDQGTQFCQVRSSDTDSIDFQWIHLSLVTVSTGESYISVYHLHVSRCLQVCEEDSLCVSVQYIVSSRMCHLYTINRYSQLGLSAGSDYYYEILKRDHCYKDLFNEVGYAVKASSELDEEHLAVHSTNGSTHYWQPATDDTDQWIKVEFESRVEVYELVIIGAHNSDSLARLTTFRFQFTADLVLWNDVINHIDGTEVYEPSAGNFGLGHFVFHDGILAKGFRLLPLTWSYNIAVQWKLLGCITPTIFQSCATGDYEISIPDIVQLNCFHDWDVILLHYQYSQLFNTTWLSYEEGFKSNTSDEFYLGNAAVWHQTESTFHKLRVDLWMEDGTYSYAEYSGFRLESDAMNYTLTVERFVSGEAESGGLVDIHSGQMFQTYDYGDVNNCAVQKAGGWWYNDCNGTSLTAYEMNWNSSQGNNLLPQKAIMRMKADLNATKLNVAIWKPTNASSQAVPLLGPELVVDGDVDSDMSSDICFKTTQEMDPYIMIDLKEPKRILEIKLVAPSDSSGTYYLEDFDVKFLPKDSSNGADISGFTLCTHYSGVAQPGEHVLVNCTHPVTTQYIAVQMLGTAKTLGVCEIEVYAEPLSNDLDAVCYGDGDCGVTYAICLPVNPAAQDLNFTCVCSQGYTPIDNICKAYVDVLFNFTLPLGVNVFRGRDINITALITVANNDTTPFDFSSTGVNFNVSMYLSDTEDIQQMASHLQDLQTLPFNYLQSSVLKKSLSGKEGLEANIEFITDILTSQCPMINFICLKLEEGANATYIDRDTSNNVVCIDIADTKECRPDADVQFLNLTYEKPLEIVRDNPGPYRFNTVLTLNALYSDIFEADMDTFNYKLTYGFFSEGEIPELSFFNGSSAVVIEPNITEVQKPLTADSSISQTLDINIQVTYLECVNMSQFCLLVADDVTSSYTEIDWTNNMYCLDIALHKECHPEVELSVGTVSFPGQIIRGYNSTAVLNFTLDNRDEVLPVSVLDKEDRNFNATLYLTTISDVTAFKDNYYEKYEIELSLEQQQSKILPSTAMIFEGIVSVYISREDCGSIKYLCLDVQPANGSSYRQPGHIVTVKCLEATTGINCDGLPAKDVSVTLNPPIAEVGATAEFFITWSEGTDLEFDIDFGDGNTFQWNWEINGHIESYGGHSASASNTYYYIGNYTMPLNIGNQIEKHLYHFNTLVEPGLSDYVNISSTYIPSMVPVHFEVIFTHINEIDKGTVVMACEVTWGDGGNATTETVSVESTSSMSKIYVQDLPNVTAHLDCVNQVSRITFDEYIMLRQAIMGLSIVPQQPAYPTFVPSFFNVTMSSGSHVILEVDFGDGTVELFNNSVIESFSLVWIIEHTYESPDNYTVNVIARNEHFTNETFLLDPVILQNSVSATSLTGETNIKVPDGLASFTLALQNTNLLPTLVSCTWKLNDLYVTRLAANLLEQGQEEIYNYQFTRNSCGKNNISAACANLVSSYTSSLSFHVYEEIAELLIFAPLGARVEENFTTIVTLANGSEVMFDLDFGDGVAITQEHSELYAVDNPTEFVYNYSSTGNYTITVTAENPVSNAEVLYDIAVQNILSDVYVSANESVLWPPGLVHFNISKCNNFTYRNVHCMWDYGQDSTEYIYIDDFLNDNWHTHTFSKAFLGLTDIKLNCSNLVSSVSLNISVDIIFDRVTLSTLNTTGWVWWTNISTAILTIERFGTHSCFEWDMGDGTKYMYGTPWCETNATKLGVDLNLLSYDVTALVVNHTYETWDNFTVNVFAYNHVSNDSRSTVSVVKDWYCNKPIVEFPDNYTNRADPIQFMRSWDFVIPSSRVFIDCMKSLNRSESSLRVYSLGNQLAIHEEILSEGIEFHHPPLMLEYGVYEIEVFMSMFEVSYVNTTTTLHIQIIPTPLLIQIDNLPLEQRFFGEILHLRATDFSFDLDLLPKSEQNIQFDWACRRIDEDFPTDGQNNILEAGPPDETILDATYSKGCFAGGPGKVAIAQSEYTLDTGLMLPNITYVIYLHGYKDTRIGSAEKVLELGSPAAPDVTVSCRENCAHKKRQSTRLVIDSACHSHCETKFGKLQFLWDLHWYDELTGQNMTYADWDINMTLSGITEPSLFVKPFTLVGGVWHTLTLTTWTPLSHVKNTIYRFLTNLPPYGGTCTIDPSEGYAKLTLFTTNCIDWKEFQPEGEQVLKFEYRIKSKGAVRSFLTYFGPHGESSPTVLPIGNLDDNFLNDFELYIFDSIGDYYIYVQEVKVYPESKQQSEAATEILGSVTDPNSDLMRASAAQDYSKVATTVYSMLSVLNIPVDYNLGVNETADESVVLEIKTTARSLLMGLVSDFPVDVMDSLEQVNEVVRSTLNIKQELDVSLIGNGVNKIESLSAFFVGERHKHHNGKKKQIATDLTASTIKVLSGGDHILQKSSSNSTENTTETVNNNQTTSANDTVRQEVGAAMNKSMAVIGTLSGALLEDKRVGDPDDVIEFEELSLIVTKATAEKLDNTTVSAKQGKLKMPRLADAFPNTDGSCIDNTVLFSFLNPYILDQSSDNVNSAVLTLNLFDCSVPGNRTRRSTSPGIAPFDVEVAAKNDNLLQVNETLDDATEMLIHRLNLSATSPKPILVSVFPQGNSTLDVFVDFKEDFDKNDHLIKFQVPMLDNIANENASAADQYELAHTLYLPVENITEQNATTIYIGVIDAGCQEGSVCEGDSSRMVYKYSLSEIQCQEWDPEKQVWSSEFCEVLPDSLPSKPKFKSNLFGSMGAGLFVGPNTIDFKNVFDNLDQKLAENAAVVGTVLGVIILYIPFVILCRLFDKRDKKKWMILPLADNIAEDQFSYELHVYTGIKKYSETDSNVHMVVAGTNSDTGIRKLSDGQRKNFNRAGVDSFLLKTNGSLGVPVTLKIWHDNSGKGNKAGWYLSKIVIVDLQTSDWYLFKCENWLSAAEGDGLIERIVHSYKDETDQNSQALLQTNIQKKLFDDHLWLSVGYRSTRSSFSRVQRLSVCLAILILTMVSNAMWFGTGDSESNQVAFTFGPISLTVHQLYTSVMSSLIVVPPIVAITMIFAKSAPKQSKNSAQGALERDDSRRRKKKRRLPYWCVFVAYILVVLSVAAGAFFTILYAFEWGKAKSEEWLVTFILSFLQSVLLIQPIKVIIVAALLSILFKQDTDVSDFEESVGGGLVEPKKDLRPANEDILKTSNLLTQDEIEAAKKRQELDKKSRGLVREVAWQIIFLAILLWVIVGNQDHNVFYQNTNLQNMFLSEIEQVEKKNDTWDWMKNNVLPKLYLTDNYNHLPLTAYDEKFIQNGYGFRLGPPRLRQIRVTEEECRLPQQFNGIVKHCTNKFESKYQETKDFLADWTYSLNDSNIEDSDQLNLSYMFQTQSDTKGTTYWGLLGYYPAGGYIANLGNTYKEAVDLVSELEIHHWIDDMTRVVFLEFNVWNANTNLFNLVTVSFEFPSSGGHVFLASIQSVNLYRYAGAGGFINLLSEAILTIFVIVLTVLEIISIAKQKKAYFRQIWNYTILLALVLFYVGFGFYVYRSILTTQTIEEMMNNKGKSVNFSLLASYNKIFLLCLGIMSFILELRLLHILRYSKTIAMLGSVLSTSALDMLNVAMCFGIIFMAFLTIFYALFGYIMYEYRSLSSGTITMMAGFLASFNFDTMKESGGYLGIVAFLIYLLVSIFFWINILISVINESISEIQGNEELQPNDHEVIDHLLSAFRSKPVSNKDNKKPPEMMEPMEDISVIAGNLKESQVMRGLDKLLEDFFVWSSTAKEEQRFEALLLPEEEEQEESKTSSQQQVDCDQVSLYSNLEELVILSLHMLSEDNKQNDTGDGKTHG